MTRLNPTENQRLALLAMCPRCEARPDEWCRYVTGKGTVSDIHASRMRVVFETQASQYGDDEQFWRTHTEPLRDQILEVRKLAEGLLDSTNHRDQFIGTALFGVFGWSVPSKPEDEVDK